ncbi:MAG: hypothetical protein Tsb002_12360 [Wenzhouxiangellaceae bacterium]
MSFSYKSLLELGFVVCSNTRENWHYFETVRGGNEIKGRRLLRYFFREDSPAIATVEIIEGEQNNAALILIRGLPSAALVMDEKAILCNSIEQ